MGNFTGFEKSEDYYIHPRLGHIKRIQKEDGPQLIQYRVLVETQDAIESWSQMINQLRAASLDQIILLPKSHFYQNIGYCDGFCELFLLFDDYMFCLKDEIKSRRYIKRNFSESSIWQILYKLIKASRLMQKFKIKVGNVRPQNILVNQQGDFKIISDYSLPKSESHIINSLTIQQNFYSPEQLSQLKDMKTKPELHKIKSQQIFFSKQNLQEQITQLQVNSNQEIFSIGVTILEICTLQQSKQIYTVKGINEAQIIKKLTQLEVKYSNDLIGILWQMLKINPEHRIKTNDLYKILNIHQQDITHHRTFQLNDGFIKPSHNKYTILDTPLGSSSKTCDTDKKKQNNFSKFFPFLRSLYNTKEVVISEISQSSKACELQPNIRLASANILNFNSA